MTKHIYSGTIKPIGYQSLSSLTGVSFEKGSKYSIQLLNPAYIREGTMGKGFLINDIKPIIYTIDEPLYIATLPSLFGIIAVNIAEINTTPNVARVDLTNINELYRANNMLYKDVLLETPFKATFEQTTIQVVANDSDYITIGTTNYTLLKADNKSVVDEDGNQLVIFDSIMYKLIDNVPESTIVQVNDI